jgi:hypothetical protein
VPDPKLAVEPAAIDLGAVRPGKGQQLELHLGNDGGRLLYGAVSSNRPWLTLGDAPGHGQKLFQCVDRTTVVVNVRGELLRAGGKPPQGRLVIDSNGGRVTVAVRGTIVIVPFPDGPLGGATTPRELADKCRQHPRDAAALFETGAVARWYVANGWDYPVRGALAGGVAAVQQFFEALGLVRPPRVELSRDAVRLEGTEGERVEEAFVVRTAEKKPIYAWATADRRWLQVSLRQVSGTDVQVVLAATVPAGVQVMQATVTVTANGGQRFVVPVTLEVVSRGVGFATPMKAIVLPPKRRRKRRRDRDGP